MIALPPLPERHVALVTPDFAVSTADAYGWVAESRGEYTPTAHLASSCDFESWEALAPLVENDFEVAVSKRHPSITKFIAALRDAGATIARMTGSGSTVFGIFLNAPNLSGLESAGQATTVLTKTLQRVSPVELAE
jgi:4-diphosphocytidyl-2-C-methyl-D-erythritol kinase